MFVQEIVNRYGSAVIAGYSGRSKLNTLLLILLWLFGSCLSSYTAQNLGAGKQERSPIWISYRCPFVTDRLPALCDPLFLCQQTDDGNCFKWFKYRRYQWGREFLHIEVPCIFMISIKLMTDGIIRGSGAMHYFVMATIPDLILRILVALLLTKRLEVRESGWHGLWLDRDYCPDDYFLSPHHFRKISDTSVEVIHRHFSLR